MQNNMFLEKYKYVLEYDSTADISKDTIESILKKTWQITPSKNNFMPYSVFILGPNKQELKNDVYRLCLKNEGKVNDIPDIEEIRYQNFKPQFWNVVSCSYLLIFTPRIETQPNPWQIHRMQQGNVYDQMNEKKIHNVAAISAIEIGMFTNTFAYFCLEKNIDVSHTMCFSNDVKDWQNISKDIKYSPIILMSLGKGLRYRQPTHDPIEQLDLKPNYQRIVKFIQ
jgi:hypothetical protein